MPRCVSAVRSLAALLLPALVGLLVLASPARALNITLDLELDDGLVADYASVLVLQNGDDLDFTVTLNGVLGPDEDLQELYFNLIGAFTGLTIVADNHPNTPYSVLVDPVTKAGAGDFDFGVSFGNGSGPPGNGSLAYATFTLSADQALSVDDLLEDTTTQQGHLVTMVAHIQSTNTPAGSEAAGGRVPEPSAALLLASALAGALSLGRKRRA